MTDIIIGIGDATPYLISAPEETRIIIRDYDVPPDWAHENGDDIEVDEDGHAYQKIILP